MRQPRLKAPRHHAVAYYHCISRVVNRDFVLKDKEREMFVHFMRMYERLCGLRVVTFCVMSNHFHVLVEVPRRPEKLPTEAELLGIIARSCGKTRAHLVRLELEELRRAGAHAAAQAIIDGWLGRMWDVSQFMKTLKQVFTQWFNKEHGRKGTLWEDRFRSVLVEGTGNPIAMMAAYIDLNPVRAGVVEDPKDYRWCGYAEAAAGIKVAKEGIATAVEAQRGRKVAANQAAAEYRQLLFTWGVTTSTNKDGTMKKRGLDRKKAAKELARGGKLPAHELLRCRVRYFTDGAVIGGRAFVDGVFTALRHRFGPKREDGARRMRGMEAGVGLFALRDLRRNVFE
ncbi:MAG: transposase [Verrucomicrobiaceae bacterium]|nr:transposase [Verrucomicrobiaceae bacterium]